MAEADSFDFETAIIVEDDSEHYDSERYGEQRFRAVGQLADGRIVVLIYTFRNGEPRPISVRKAGQGKAVHGQKNDP